MQQTESSSPTPQSQNGLFTPRNLIFLSIFAAVLIILSTVGTYVVLKSKVQKTPISQDVSISPTSTIMSPTVTTDEMKDWRTYTNAKFGYSFQYPPTLSISNCPTYDCGETIYYPKAPGRIEIDENNRLANSALIGEKYCQENKFKDSTNFNRASLQAQCDLPGVSTVTDPILPVIDQQITDSSNGLSQYSFYLQSYQNTKLGPFYAFFFPKSIKKMNINNDSVTYYGLYWTPNTTKSLTSDKIFIFNQILSTFKFSDQK